MGLMDIVYFLAYRAVELTVVIITLLLVMLYLPGLPPNAEFSKSYSVSPASPFDGTLKLNERLNDVEIWHKGGLMGAESFADHNGELYTSLHGGEVVKLTETRVTPIVKFGRPCKGYHDERKCGRAGGMDFDKNGNLYVVDVYHGLYRVDVATGATELLVAHNEVIDGRNVTLLNAVAVASNGDLYWTDSSTEFMLLDGVFDMLADGSGRLIHYDSKTGKNTVLISNIHFANGVVLSDDEEFVLVAETARNRILRYYLKGPKKGTHDIFIEGLPGMPDNLKSDGKSGFIVPLVWAVDARHPAISQFLGPCPLTRKFLARLLALVKFTFKSINDIYANEITEKAVHMVGHFNTMSFLRPARVTILHLSKNGEILDSIHSNDNRITGISEAYIFGDTLYLASPFSDYIGRIPLSKVGWELLKKAPTIKPSKAAPASKSQKKKS